MPIQIPPAPPPPPLFSHTERQELLDEIQALKTVLHLRNQHINKLNDLINLYRSATDLLDEVIK